MSTVPISTAAADLPFALRRAERYVESRSYVAKRAHDLGLGELVPASWGIPAPSARTKTEAAVSGITAAGWDASLHPRGRDGKFIELHGLLNLFDGTGFVKPSMRAEAIGVRKEGGKDILTVRAKSVGKFGGKTRAVGDEFDVPSGMAEAAPDSKARMTHPVFKGEVKPQGEAIKGEATDLKKAQDRADAAAKELADAEASGDKARITKARTSNTAARKNLEKQQALEDKAGEDLTSQLEQSVAQLDKPAEPDVPDAPESGGLADSPVGTTLRAQTGNPNDDIQKDVDGNWYDGNGEQVDPADINGLDYKAEGTPEPDAPEGSIDDTVEALMEDVGEDDFDPADAKAALVEQGFDPDEVDAALDRFEENYNRGAIPAGQSDDGEDYNTGFGGGDLEPTTEW